MAAGDLTDLAGVKAWGRITDDAANVDTLLSRLITAASAAVKAAVSRTISRATFTEIRSGDDAVGRGMRIYLREYPVNSITSITENGTALTFGTGYDTTKNVIYIADEGILLRQGTTTAGMFSPLSTPGRWQPGQQNITIVYNAGWDFPRAITPVATDLPYDIEQVVCEMVATMFEQGGWKGETTRSYGGASTQMLADLSPQAKMILSQYERGFRL